MAVWSLFMGRQNINGKLLLLKHENRSRLNAWLEIVENQIRISVEVESVEIMKCFIMAGLGLRFLAISDCKAEIASGRLRSIPLEPEPMKPRRGLICRRDEAFSKAGLGFIQVVLENVDRM
jgi:DNA-binding transcriptional LysR family regulator